MVDALALMISHGLLVLLILRLLKTPDPAIPKDQKKPAKVRPRA